MSAPANHLRVVDTGTGEVQDDCASCAMLRDQLKGAETENRGWRARCAALERDREAEARDSDLWEPIQELFLIWRVDCKHPKSPYTADRFWAAEPFYRRHGREMCERAIAGRTFDSYSRPRRNGSTQRYDDWSKHIFKDSAAFQECCNRAPRGWEPAEAVS